MLMFTVRMGFDSPRLGSGTGVTDFASVAGRLAIQLEERIVEFWQPIRDRSLALALSKLPLCVSRAVAAQSEGSASDDVDGSPAMPEHNLRLSRKERENEAGHDNRIGYREVHFSSARGRGGG
jgi:hypothetical protein